MHECAATEMHIESSAQSLTVHPHISTALKQREDEKKWIECTSARDPHRAKKVNSKNLHKVVCIYGNCISLIPNRFGSLSVCCFFLISKRWQFTLQLKAKVSAFEIGFSMICRFASKQMEQICVSPFVSVERTHNNDSNISDRFCNWHITKYI